MTAEPGVESVQRLAELLLARSMMVVTAESCTGGGIAWRFTSVPGSAHWFERGFVTYSNAAKREALGVSEEILEHYGAVSEEMAAAMAEGALRHSHGDISVAVTGIAGPGGGTPYKPVGYVCFGWAMRNQAPRTTHVFFEGDRREIREQSIAMAIQGLIDILESHQE
ncbi:MAG: CinA family protein [Gammaproteobacteria bacterium]